MERPEIKQRLRQKGITLKDLALSLKVSNSAISQVLGRTQRSARIEKGVASALGLNVSDVFPERYLGNFVK